MGTLRLAPVTDASAWRGADLRDTDSWIYHLAPEHITDVDAAIDGVVRRGLSLSEIERADFPLPTMQPLFARALNDLARGRGFCLLRGLPVGRYSEQDASLIVWGIGTHFGMGVTQNAAEELVGRVYDRGLRFGDPNVRAYQVRAELGLHCDPPDVVGLCCLRKAKSGGVSILTSAMTVYNEILQTHSEYLGILFSGFVYGRKGEHAAGEPTVSPKIPVFSDLNGVLSCRYARSYIEYARANDGIELTPIEQEALDVFDAVARREDVRLDMMLEPGDMQFANNYVVLHARTGYEDYAEPERKRHMLRLWLEAPSLRDVADDIVRYGFIRFGKLGKTAKQLLAQRRAQTQMRGRART